MQDWDEGEDPAISHELTEDIRDMQNDPVISLDGQAYRPKRDWRPCVYFSLLCRIVSRIANHIRDRDELKTP
jgi:hypothetical protein